MSRRAGKATAVAGGGPRAAPRAPPRGGRARLGRAALALALAALALAVGFDRWVAATDLPPLAIDTSTLVLAHDGRLLRAYTVDDGRWRLPVDPARVDAGYLAMLIAYEDRRFYDHAGVDPLAMARALVQAAVHGRRVSGASTLTMQVARLLEDGATGTWSGKLRQLRVALALERVLSKDEILALYLQRAPMGGNLEGVRAGSLAWFGREPERLTEAQAALLVALPQAPALRNPDLHPEEARVARDRVLARAATLGVIAEEAAAAAGRTLAAKARSSASSSVSRSSNSRADWSRRSRLASSSATVRAKILSVICFTAASIRCAVASE